MWTTRDFQRFQSDIFKVYHSPTFLVDYHKVLYVCFLWVQVNLFNLSLVSYNPVSSQLSITITSLALKRAKSVIWLRFTCFGHFTCFCSFVSVILQVSRFSVIWFSCLGLSANHSKKGCYFSSLVLNIWPDTQARDVSPLPYRRKKGANLNSAPSFYEQERTTFSLSLPPPVEDQIATSRTMRKIDQVFVSIYTELSLSRLEKLSACNWNRLKKKGPADGHPDRISSLSLERIQKLKFIKA